MAAHQEYPIFGSGPHQTNRRHRGRIRCEMLTSSLGPLMDLSALGMRLVHVGKPAPAVNKTLLTRLNCKIGELSVEARVCWVQKVGFRRQAVGLEFVSLPQQAQTALLQIARFSACPWTQKTPYR